MDNISVWKILFLSVGGMIASNMKDQKLMQAIKDFGAALEKINGESIN